MNPYCDSTLDFNARVFRFISGASLHLDFVYYLLVRLDFNVLVHLRSYTILRYQPSDTDHSFLVIYRREGKRKLDKMVQLRQSLHL